ncbi:MULTISPECIES: benzoate/H(+) symporter BenE family transporter [Arthrobacter]|uniref:Benzoate/H(+) symporter BenE family transporter n=2 Tax=Arthrobacter TaxID=1663 RepID=A0ABU9KLR9_9MICC|nr:benzoate/H(+) symporter BenE family transporter [Arthrobacter sp. YJM1]MDP5228471.1 benzoate/H(+) symporter BenE family transporter [Arthrobacter sp. YJM1]
MTRGKTPLLERPGLRPASPRVFLRDLEPASFSNALIGTVFTVTGPVAVILAVGRTGGLSTAQLASWLFGVFFFGGVLTILASLLYRQPLGFAFTIPGTVLVGTALTHLSWPEVVGAFFATAALMLLLGLSGLVRTVMSAIPLPVVMAMVAGVFLKFGTDLVASGQSDPGLVLPMILAFVLLTALPRLGRFLPPVLGALLVGAAAVALSGRFRLQSAGDWFAAPVLTTPVFSPQALLELVVPLAITVLVVQNGQGTAVLTAAGHRPPVNVCAVVCGLFSFANASVGGVSACLTGPTNAILTSSGEERKHYSAAVLYGVLLVVFGLFAPGFAALMLAAPPSFILALGGIAMFRSLQQAFVAAFRTDFTLSALVTFVVTVSGLSVANIGSAFWGLLLGFAVSWTMERGDHGRENT